MKNMMILAALAVGGLMAATADTASADHRRGSSGFRSGGSGFSISIGSPRRGFLSYSNGPGYRTAYSPYGYGGGYGGGFAPRVYAPVYRSYVVPSYGYGGGYRGGYGGGYGGGYHCH